MDRIKRLSLEILDKHKEKFGTDFEDNKKTLETLSIVRSKGLKNKIAGFITKFIKQEIQQQESSKEQALTNEQQIESEQGGEPPKEQENLTEQQNPQEEPKQQDTVATPQTSQSSEDSDDNMAAEQKQEQPAQDTKTQDQDSS